MALSKTIKKYRCANGFSVNEAAALAEISVSYWEKLETGQVKNPSLSVLRRIARSLEINTAVLLEPEMTAQK